MSFRANGCLTMKINRDAFERSLQDQWWTIDELAEHFGASRTNIKLRMDALALRSRIFVAGSGVRGEPRRFRICRDATMVKAS